jgi:hypothetical protein
MRLEQAFFLERANGGGADFDFDLLAINGQSFGLQIRLPDLFGVALGKADVMAVLLGLFIKFKSLHNSVDYICYDLLGQGSRHQEWDNWEQFLLRL